MCYLCEEHKPELLDRMKSVEDEFKRKDSENTKTVSKAFGPHRKE